MRKAVICAQMITACLMLVSCGQRGDPRANELALEIRAKYLAMTGCAGQMEVVADYGERVYEYVIDFTYEREGELVMVVVEPENVAGITARVTSDGDTQLEFEGASLETGPLSGEGLSPIDSLPALLRSVKEGCIADSGFETLGEEETLRILCRDPEGKPGEGLEETLWFDRQTHELLRGEISCDGYVVVRCEFLTFTLATNT